MARRISTTIPASYNPTRDPATAEHFALWREHAKSAPIESLMFIIKDCIEAAHAMRDHNPTREGFYMDQASTYRTVLNERLNPPRRMKLV